MSLGCGEHRHKFQAHIADDEGIVWSGRQHLHTETAYKEGVDEAARFIPFQLLKPLLSGEPGKAFPQEYDLANRAHALFLEQNCQLRTKTPQRRGDLHFYTDSEPIKDAEKQGAA